VRPDRGHIGQGEHFGERIEGFRAALSGQRERRVEPHVVGGVAGELPKPFDGRGPA
jgi:hypothetical protein